MRFEKKNVVKTITAIDPAVFDAECNAFLESAANCEFHFHEIPGKYSVTITAVINKDIAESIAEKYEIAHQRHNCSECKGFHQSHDKRIKFIRCDREHLVSGDTPCCDHFYEELEKAKEVITGNGNGKMENA